MQIPCFIHTVIPIVLHGCVVTGALCNHGQNYSPTKGIPWTYAAVQFSQNHVLVHLSGIYYNIL